MAVTAESLLREELLAYYPPEARADLERARRVDANPGGNPSIPAHLSEAAGILVSMAPAVFGSDPELDFSDASIHRLSAKLTAALRDKLRASKRDGAPSELFQVIVHGAAYVGECIVRNHGGVWEARQPLWESRVALSSHAGDASLSVLSWWLGALSDDALEGEGRGTLADRYRTHVEVPTFDVATLPELVTERVDRSIPRLKKPTYSNLYQLLKAHVPEVRDLGADFPSPERWDDMRMRWVEVMLLGAGKLVLLFGPGEGGLHMIWLDASGFHKAAFFPFEGSIDPIVRMKQPPVLEVVLPGESGLVSQEILYWGP